MDVNRQQARAPIRLVSLNSLWIAGFQGLFGDPCGVEIVAVSLTEALGSNRPDVVLIDSGSFKAAGSLRDILGRFRRICPQARLIVIGCDYDADGQQNTDTDNLYIQRLIQAGAKGFLKPSSRPDEFDAALQWVRSGSIWAPRQVLSRLVQTSQSVQGPRENAGSRDGLNRGAFANVSARFTPREGQVLQLLVGGQGNREIGENLGIGSMTVKAHIGRIMLKAGVANRVELTMYAMGERSAAPLGLRARVVIPIDAVCAAN